MFQFASVNLNSFRGTAILRWAWRLTMALGLVFCLLLAGIYVFLQRDPDALIRDYLKPLEEETGLVFKINSVDVSLLPLPMLSLSGISVTGPKLLFTARLATARPSLWGLVRLEPGPGLVTIDDADLELKTDLNIADPASLSGSLNSDGSSPAPLALAGMELDARQISARILGADDSALEFVNCNADIDFARDGGLSGTLDLAVARLMQTGREIGAVQNFAISGSANYQDFLKMPADLKAAADLRYEGIVKRARLNAGFTNSQAGWSCLYGLAADLDLEGNVAPLSINGRAEQSAGSAAINVPALDWSLGHDSGSLIFAYTPAQPEQGFDVSGILVAKRLSLTEWMGWARNLPPGLQIALDKVTDAQAHFKVDAKGLAATRIEATCSGSRFGGDGGVADWSRPVVALNLRTPRAILESGVPEALGITPEAPFYSHPPLTPMPTEPLQPGEEGIGYRINLTADILKYGAVTFQNASLLAHPGKLDKNGFHDVLLDGKGALYGGSATGTCILGADPSLPYHISAKAKGVNAAPLARDLPVLPVKSGIFDAQAVVTSRGKILSAFLKSLKGDLSVAGANVSLAQAGQNLVLQKLGASLRLRSGSWDGEKLGMDGVWSSSVAMNGIEGSCELNGKLVFGSGGVSLRNLPGEIRLARKDAPRFDCLLKGAFSANPDQGKFEARRAKLEALGESAQGELSLDAGKKGIALAGALKTTIRSLNALLGRMGMKKPAVPQAFDSLTLATDFSGSSEQIKFTKINAKAGQSQISGSLTWDAQKMHFDVNLDANMVNLASLSDKKSKNAPVNWDFPALAEFGASGRLGARDLVIWDLRFVNVSVPFRLEKGKLAIPDARANFCGGPATLHATADFNKGLAFDASLSVKGFNLTQAARDRRMDTRLTGSASAQAKIGAKLSGDMKALPALNGQWAITINQGSWQTADKDGKLKGSPTTFRLLKGSGNMRNGTIRSDNILLTGESMDVSGGGSVNLVSRQVDCDFNVDLNGLPAFPLRLYGSLDKPDTSIGMGRLALNAISGLGSGVASTIGGLFRGIWGVFVP